MTRDCEHSTGDDQRLQTVQMSKRLQTVQEMTRDCGPLVREGERCGHPAVITGCLLRMREKRCAL
ncbi:unnamed protein product [Staurois parvus]|uniref:Uncharacterized protein n=1 Tax=Staurois parvus TaxID=386267 RepID=A0ABN9APE7_9NEOB|nr:unnamed protein product [Staurois parvus]